MDPSTCGVIQSIVVDPVIYRPLDPVSRQIRLLKLHPGTGEEDIECHLEHVSLEDNPEFTALSYVWGDFTDPHRILLHNVPFRVTKNLHAALRSIRSCFPGISKLWVDALCINQQDPAERSCQVPLMQFIYSEAKHTIVWFGPGSELSKRAVQLMVEMKNTLEPKDNPWFNEKLKNAISARYSAAVHPMTHLLDRLEAWEALLYLVDQPWWTRVWVAQEIEFSKDPLLLWGEDTLLWIHCEGAMAMTTLWLGLIARDRDFQEVHNMLQLKKGIQKAAAIGRLFQRRLDEAPRKELLHLMNSFWLSEATDPRDKVYALLGLAVDSHSESIIPNYESPVSLVYAESVKDVIIREDNLQVLSYCSGLFTPRDAAIPSWAPNWRSTSHDSSRPLEQRHKPLHVIDRVLRKDYVSAKPKTCVFRAAGDFPPSVGFCKQMKTLYTVGTCVDVISKIISTRSYGYSQILRDWTIVSGFDGHTIYYSPTRQLRTDAYLETLSAGQFTLCSQAQEFEEGIGFATAGRRFFVGEAGYQG